jgi:hypothetical protein
MRFAGFCFRKYSGFEKGGGGLSVLIDLPTNRTAEKGE